MSDYGYDEAMRDLAIGRACAADVPEDVREPCSICPMQVPCNDLGHDPMAAFDRIAAFIDQLWEAETERPVFVSQLRTEGRAMLTSTTFVMKRNDEYLDTVGRRIFNYAGDGEMPLIEEFGTLSVPVSRYEDMGSPERITVTVVPGDRLNSCCGDS